MTAGGSRRGNLVYHWRHGWIPLDHYAALKKAKGNPSLARKYADQHGLPASYRSQNEAEASLNRSLPKGYSAQYVHARAGAIGGTSGYVVTHPDGSKSPKMAAGPDVRAHVYRHVAATKAGAGEPATTNRAQPTHGSGARPWSVGQANQEFLANQAKTDASSPRGSISSSQVDLIQQLLIKKSRSGTGDGFVTGPRTRQGILKLSRSQAAAYINSLRGDY